MSKLHCIVNGPLQVNTYVLGIDEKTCYVIDPGHDYEKINKYIKRHDLDVKAILLTHGHFDHFGGANDLVNDYHCPLYIHPLDKELIIDEELNYSKSFSKILRFRGEIKNIMELNDANLRIFHTPGHSAGGVIIQILDSKSLLTGDTLFAQDIGRVDLYGASKDAMNESLLFIKTLPDDLSIHPGHEESSTLLFEKKYNRYLQ